MGIVSVSIVDIAASIIINAIAVGAVEKEGRGRRGGEGSRG